jgi:hypothetical protein
MVLLSERFHKTGTLPGLTQGVLLQQESCSAVQRRRAAIVEPRWRQYAPGPFRPILIGKTAVFYTRAAGSKCNSSGMDRSEKAPGGMI